MMSLVSIDKHQSSLQHCNQSILSAINMKSMICITLLALAACVIADQLEAKPETESVVRDKRGALLASPYALPYTYASGLSPYAYAPGYASPYAYTAGLAAPYTAAYSPYSAAYSAYSPYAYYG